MKILFIGDDTKVSDTVMEKIFRDVVHPVRSHIEEIAILNASSAELYAIKLAKKLHIPYLGFLYNADAAKDYADQIVFIGKGDENISPFFLLSIKPFIKCIVKGEDIRYEGAA